MTQPGLEELNLMPNTRDTIIMVAYPPDSRTPSMQSPCANEDEAKAIARDFASEWGQTMKLLVGPIPSDPYASPKDSELRLVGFIEPAKPANDGVRAIFVSNPMTIEAVSNIYTEDPEVIIHSPELDAQELRFWLLFWDEIGIATNNVEPRNLSATEQFLRDAGILNRWATNWACEVECAELYRDSFLFAFRRVNKIQPGKWSAAIGGRSISFHVPEDRSSRAALVRLYQSVPIPASDVPLADLLEFRQRRRAELMAFRHDIEAIYQRVQRAGDGELAWNSEVESLQRTLIDLVKVAREGSFKFLKGSFDAKLNLPTAVAAGLTAHQAGLSMLGALLSAAGAAVAVQTGVGLKDRSTLKTPYSYVAKYHTELPWL
jgi:hypothetical protein